MITESYWMTPSLTRRRAFRSFLVVQKTFQSQDQITRLRFALISPAAFAATTLTPIPIGRVSGGRTTCDCCSPTGATTERRGSRCCASSTGPTTTTSSVPSCSRRPSCARSEEHTSELQSRQYLVCRLLLEKEKINYTHQQNPPAFSAARTTRAHPRRA